MNIQDISNDVCGNTFLSGNWMQIMSLGIVNNISAKFTIQRVRIVIGNKCVKPFKGGMS